MQFQLEVTIDNSAFADDQEDGAVSLVARNSEVARILRQAAARVEEGWWWIPLNDQNGNRVGELRFVE